MIIQQGHKISKRIHGGREVSKVLIGDGATMRTVFSKNPTNYYNGFHNDLPEPDWAKMQQYSSPGDIFFRTKANIWIVRKGYNSKIYEKLDSNFNVIGRLTARISGDSRLMPQIIINPRGDKGKEVVRFVNRSTESTFIDINSFTEWTGLDGGLAGGEYISDMSGSPNNSLVAADAKACSSFFDDKGKSLFAFGKNILTDEDNNLVSPYGFLYLEHPFAQKGANYGTYLADHFYCCDENYMIVGYNWNCSSLILLDFKQFCSQRHFTGTFIRDIPITVDGNVRLPVANLWNGKFYYCNGDRFCGIYNPATNVIEKEMYVTVGPTSGIGYNWRNKVFLTYSKTVVEII